MMESVIATLVLALVAAITYAVVNDYQWLMRFGRVSGERNALLMKPVIEADEKRGEARKAAGIPASDYILSHATSGLAQWTYEGMPDYPMYSTTTTSTFRPRKRRHYRQEVY